jgi:transcriptional regulator with XRE-family HTH domain
MSAATIKFFRNKENNTQEYVASILDISQPAYGKLENGKRKKKEIPNDIAEKLAALYKVEKELFLEEGNSSINYVSGTQNKGIISENYYEAGKELLQTVFDKADEMLLRIKEERAESENERKQMFGLLNKIVEKLDK